MLTKRKIFQKTVNKEDMPAACVGAFLALIGLITLFFSQQMSGRMMLLVGLCSCVWGAACILRVYRNREEPGDLLRGVYFLLFGTAILLSNLAGVMFSARVLGTMLFLYGAAPLALMFIEKPVQMQRFFYCTAYALCGCLLVLFAGQRGMLSAGCVMLCGLCMVMEAMRAPHKFLFPGDAKGMQKTGR